MYSTVRTKAATIFTLHHSAYLVLDGLSLNYCILLYVQKKNNHLLLYIQVHSPDGVEVTKTHFQYKYLIIIIE